MRLTRPLRLMALFLVLCLCLPFAACSKYRVEMSDERQSRTVMTLDGYDVPFELVYFFYKNSVEGGHEDKLARAVRDAAEMYAIFSVAKSRGIDPFGEEMNRRVDNAVREMIDSFDTRREYIDNLTRRHMTDNAYRLLLRSYLCEARLHESDMQSEMTDEVLAFCEREEVVRAMALVVYYQDESLRTWAEQRAATLAGMLALAPNTDAAFEQIAGSEASFEEHNYMTLAELRRLTGESADFLPEYGYTTDPLFEGGSFVILRITDKDLTYVENNPLAVMPAYIDHLISEATSPVTSLLIPLTEADFA